MIEKMSFRKAAKKNKFNKKCAKPMRGAVGERDSQGKHRKEFDRWMAVKKEGRKKSAHLQS